MAATLKKVRRRVLAMTARYRSESAWGNETSAVGACQRRAVHCGGERLRATTLYAE
jgi:hypothetical protein